jgi:hypothetical protein
MIDESQILPTEYYFVNVSRTVAIRAQNDIDAKQRAISALVEHPEKLFAVIEHTKVKDAWFV